MRAREAFRFQPVTAKVWTGRYRRVPGDTTTFHVHYRDGRWWPVVEWARGDEAAICPLVDDGDGAGLANAVNAGKAAHGGGSGGSFLIDEYGRVLVPVGNGSGTVIVVGECSGPLRFENSFEPGTVFDLYGDDGISAGDPWDRPYAGLRHQLSKSSELYFWQEDALGGRKLIPPAQDQRLVGLLRRVRPYGAVRFLTGPGGVVITKVAVSREPERWEPRYVGRIDLSSWFEKEVLS